MANVTVKIKPGLSLDPDPVPVIKNDMLSWNNTTDYNVTITIPAANPPILTPPSSFPLVIPKGTQSDGIRVNPNFDQSESPYNAADDGPMMGTRAGTIRVG